VHVEQDPRGGDRGRHARGGGGEPDPLPAGRLAREHERRRREERRAPRRVSARERRAERLGDRVEARPHAVGEMLDRRRDHPVARNDDSEERDDPAVARAHGLDDRERHRERDDRPRLPDLRQRVQDVVRERRRVRAPPAGGACVEADGVRIAAEDEREHREHEAAADQHDQCERQRQAGRGVRVEPPRPARRGPLGTRLDLRPAARHQRDDGADNGGYED